VKYAAMPYPSCGSCQTTGWTIGQDLDHFSCHETREAVTDPNLNAWSDSSGNEADDKCAWDPQPFLVDGFGYQYEWSNQHGACVSDIPIQHPTPPVSLAPILALLLDAECGDGTKDPDEECDDGNTLSGDGCSAECRTESPSSAAIPLAGKRILVRDRGDVRTRSLSLVLSDTSVTVTAGIDPVVDGAALQMFNPTTGEVVCLNLPASGGAWRVAGTGANVGYKYRDRAYANGPCSAVALKRGTLTATCRATVQPISYSLDESQQESVAVSFTTGERTLCALFGGIVTKDVGTGATGHGQFAARNAPRPVVCVDPPASCP
jgi:cysteine-rich repeat protein